jgi:hypothetical protein
MTSVIIGQWANQTINVGFNYCNANKSDPLSTFETCLAYFSACGSSCAIAVGLNQWLKRTKVSNTLLPILSRAVPFTAGINLLKLVVVR